MADEEPRRRSRFDADPPARKSRFGDRSASPARRESDSHRSRSPISKSAEGEGTPDKQDAAAAAAAAAAKINASLNAKKGIQHVDVPPIRSNPSPSATSAGAAKSPMAETTPSGTLNADIYQQDGDYIRDIEVNDLRNRYTLTKGATQKMIKDKTGADVTTRGNYYPDKSMATAANPPLYLHITSQTKEGLEKAVEEINEMMKEPLPDLIDQRRFRRREPEQVERDSLGRRKWPEERIPIDLEPIPGFNLRAQVVGAGGSYVKHIQQETRCRVQIKGRGSGFMEHDTGRESDEQMYLHVAGPDPAQVATAKEMCHSLLQSVKEQYDNFKEHGPRGGQGNRGYGGGDRGGGGGYGDNRGGYQQSRREEGADQYGYGQQAQGGYGQQGAGGYGGQQSPVGYGQQPADPYAQQAAGYAGGAQSPTSATNPADPAAQQQQMQAWMDYYTQNPSQDPYLQYGGYAYVMYQYYAQANGQAGGQQQGQNGMEGAAGAPPPPPPPQDSEQVPPPPPPNA